MTDKMKYTDLKHIVFLQNSQEAPIWGGLEKLMFEWFERIDYRQCRVTLAIPKGWKNLFEGKLQAKGIPVEVVELSFKLEGASFLKKFLNLFSLLQKLRVSSVVFMQSWFSSFDLAHVLAGYFVAPGRVYMHENLGPSEPPEKLSRRYLGLVPGIGIWWRLRICLASLRALFSKKIVVVSREIKEKLVSLWRYPPKKILVQYHGVDLKRYSPSSEICVKMRKDLMILPEETVIIIASRLTKVKCVHRVIEAFDGLYSKSPNATLIIIGTGPLEDSLKTLAQSKTGGQKMLFLGHVNNVADYFKMSDIFVLASDNEGFSIALLEAMASGLVCVATRCPGTNEIIHDGVNGFLVEKSTEGVLSGLKKALELSTEERRKIAEKAVSFVKENFEINQRIRDVFGVLGIAYSISGEVTGSK